MATNQYREDHPFFLITVTGTGKVKRMLQGAVDATTYSLYQGRLERLLVDRAKRRLDELGSSSISQKAPPDDKLWAPVSDSYIERHKNPNRLLYRTGTLQAAITASRRKMVGSLLQSPTGAGFRIGIDSGSPANEYARYHQFGTESMPARRFLGISKADVYAVDDWIYRNFKKFGIRAGI